MIITKPRPLDAEGVYDLIKNAWYFTYINKDIGVSKEDIDSIYKPEEREKSIVSIKNRYENDRENEVELIAKENGQPIAVIRLVINERDAELRTLYVDPEYFGKGVGTLLWEEGVKKLSANFPVFVEVVSYTKAVDFYRKIGFVDTGERYTKEGATMKVSGIKMPFMKMIYNR